MDFIGQKGPTSKIHLVLLDMLLIVLQMTHMAADMVRKKLKEASAVTAPSTTPQSAPQAAPLVRQDLDAEERGVIRSDEQQDIEMQTLNPSTGTAASVPSNPNNADSIPESSEHDSLLTSSELPPPRSDAHIFDAFNSGQIVVADLDVWKCVKEQCQLIRDYRKDPANAQASSMQNLRAEMATRFLRMRAGTEAVREAIR